MMILAANDASVWSWYLWPILQFIIGLGVVVFVHELGHFLVAKWVGIKVEKFALGFGPRLVGIVRGETDYCINVVPLGGYVKMLGQEDFKPLSETDKPDPRAFNSKSVGARFAVIAAGVVMNLIMAAILFILISMIGMKTAAPVIGMVSPASPAAEAKITWASAAPSRETASQPAQTSVGLQSGDEVLRINGDSFIIKLLGDRVRTFGDVQMTSILADRNDRYAFTIQRQVDGQPRIGVAQVGVHPSPEGVLVFGLTPASDVVVGRPEKGESALPFQEGDVITSVAGKPVKTQLDIQAIERDLTSEPVAVTVRRGGQAVDLQVPLTLEVSGKTLYLKDGSMIRFNKLEPAGDEFQVQLSDGTTRTLKKDEVDPMDRLRILGMIPRLRVNAVKAGSPAGKAGMKAGDIIVAYGDQINPTQGQLMDVSSKVVDSGTDIVVLRQGQRLTLSVTPQHRNGLAVLGIEPGSDTATPLAAGVSPNSPAAQAGIESGAVLKSINGVAVENWNDVYRALSSLTGGDIVISYQLGSREMTARMGPLTSQVFSPSDYQFGLFSGVPFEPLQVLIHEENPAKALAWGTRETIRQVLSTYAGLRGLIKGNVSPRQMTGPLGMGAVAVQLSRRGPVEFLYFMAFISAALAVFNFLPIPVVDGGHAVFLLIEKIRRKPVSIAVQNVTQLIGLVLLLGVFLAVTWNDIMRWIKW